MYVENIGHKDKTNEKRHFVIKMIAINLVIGKNIINVISTCVPKILLENSKKRFEKRYMNLSKKEKVNF